jgi:hypothetical protein
MSFPKTLLLTVSKVRRISYRNHESTSEKCTAWGRVNGKCSVVAAFMDEESELRSVYVKYDGHSCRAGGYLSKRPLLKDMFSHPTESQLPGAVQSALFNTNAR